MRVWRRLKGFERGLWVRRKFACFRSSTPIAGPASCLRRKEVGKEGGGQGGREGAGSCLAAGGAPSPRRNTPHSSVGSIIQFKSCGLDLWVRPRRCRPPCFRFLYVGFFPIALSCRPLSLSLSLPLFLLSSFILSSALFLFLWKTPRFAKLVGFSLYNMRLLESAFLKYY